MKNILVSVDIGEACAKVVVAAVEMARACSAKLWLVYVTPLESHKWGPDYIGNESDSGLPRRQEAAILQEKHRKIQQMAQSLRDDGLDASALMIEGLLHEKILGEAERVDADMIVMGSHCHGALFHLLLGNVSDWVVQHSKRPVLIIPTEPA